MASVREKRDEDRKKIRSDAIQKSNVDNVSASQSTLNPPLLSIAADVQQEEGTKQDEADSSSLTFDRAQF